ncbi:MAG: LPS export ABC transporter periplasmic protein LptC, partial [Microcystaceae cyanobacterium]
STSACQETTRLEQKIEQDTAAASKLETGLSLNNATLEQANSKGQTLWKIKVTRAIYNPDKKTAQLENIAGNLFQDGKVVLQVSAKKGEVRQEAEEIFLREKIIVTDPRNKATFRSEEVEWHPKQDVLFVRQNLTGSHPQLEASAQAGKYYTRQQRLELIGNIIATAKDPRLQLKAEHLFWEIPQQKVIGDRPLNMVRYEGQTITDRVKGDRAQVNLQSKTAILQQNIEFKSLDPPVQLTANTATWHYKQRLVTSTQPVQVFHYKDQITLTGNQVQVNLKDKIAYLKGGVHGVNKKDPAKLYANEAVWKISAQQIEAAGNVTYEQTKPKFTSTGDKAVGTLKDHKMIVSSNSRDRVVTEIFPE